MKEMEDLRDWIALKNVILNINYYVTEEWEDVGLF